MADIGKSEMCNGKRIGRIGERPYWVLYLSILLRALHQVGAAVFLASFLLGGIGHPPSVYLAITLASGVALYFTEWMRHRQIYRELAGVCTLVKLLLVGVAFHGFLSPPLGVLLAFVLASIGAHAPKIIRHKLLF